MHNSRMKHGLGSCVMVVLLFASILLLPCVEPFELSRCPFIGSRSLLGHQASQHTNRPPCKHFLGPHSLLVPARNMDKICLRAATTPEWVTDNMSSLPNAPGDSPTSAKEPGKMRWLVNLKRDSDGTERIEDSNVVTGMRSSDHPQQPVGWFNRAQGRNMMRPNNNGMKPRHPNTKTNKNNGPSRTRPEPEQVQLNQRIAVCTSPKEIFALIQQAVSSRQPQRIRSSAQAFFVFFSQSCVYTRIGTQLFVRAPYMDCPYIHEN
jgi:hypothetical protein